MDVGSSGYCPLNDQAQSENLNLLPLDALRGLDSAIVSGFLNLGETTRSTLISEYAARHGGAAGAWLGHAATLWPSARLGVSRVTLARLFALLPEYMSQQERLELAKSIWHTARAPTKAVLNVPPGYRNHALLSELVREHFLAVLPSVLELPEALQQRVAWLNDPALKAQQDVLNLLLLAERDQLLLLADEQIEVLFARRLDGMEIRSTFNIAGHSLLLKTSTSVDEPEILKQRLSASRPQTTGQSMASRSAIVGGLIGTLVALIIVGLIVFLN